MTFKEKLVLTLSTGLGLGLSPFASGTFGTLLGVVIVVVMGMCPMPWWWQVVASALMVAVAIPICGAAESIYGTKDDGRIVADEYLTFPLCMIGLPWLAHPWLLLVGFLSHRFLDIIKPAPARQAQVIRGGIGVVIDDVISSVYALGVNHAVFWAYVYLVGRS